MSINVNGAAGAVSGLTNVVANVAEKVPVLGTLCSGICRCIGGVVNGGLSKIFGG